MQIGSSEKRRFAIFVKLHSDWLNDIVVIFCKSASCKKRVRKFVGSVGFFLADRRKVSSNKKKIWLLMKELYCLVKPTSGDKKKTWLLKVQFH